MITAGQLDCIRHLIGSGTAVTVTVVGTVLVVVTVAVTAGGHSRLGHCYRDRGYLCRHCFRHRNRAHRLGDGLGHRHLCGGTGHNRQLPANASVRKANNSFLRIG
ncbi:MAG TPA: hypothetical protein G4O03_03730 [Dehalococcoidia bacterium]|nr:hypothetical protein [Dehalococcoidia bacterium]